MPLLLFVHIHIPEPLGRIILLPLVIILAFVLSPELFYSVQTDNREYLQMVEDGLIVDVEILSMYEKCTDTYTDFCGNYISYQYQVDGKNYDQEEYLSGDSAPAFYRGKTTAQAYYSADDPGWSILSQNREFYEQRAERLFTNEAILFLAWCIPLGLFWRPPYREKNSYSWGGLFFDLMRYPIAYTLIIEILWFLYTFPDIPATLPLLTCCISMELLAIFFMLPWADIQLFIQAQQEFRSSSDILMQILYNLAFPVFLALFTLGFILLAETLSETHFIIYLCIGALIAFWMRGLRGWLNERKHEIQLFQQWWRSNISSGIF